MTLEHLIEDAFIGTNDLLDEIILYAEASYGEQQIAVLDGLDLTLKRTPSEVLLWIFEDPSYSTLKPQQIKFSEVYEEEESYFVILTYIPNGRSVIVRMMWPD